jgi:uncharacterized protein (DUF924 family)
MDERIVGTILDGGASKDAYMKRRRGNMEAMMSVPAEAEDIIRFWREAGYKRWFGKDDAFDAEIRSRFGDLQRRAGRGELADWEATPTGALALVILLDQFSRNLHRGTTAAFDNDPAARGVADRALERGFDHRVEADLRMFFYLPFMHSEVLADQERCVGLYALLGDENSFKFAQDHRDIIARFGRFPHRNPVLGRMTTAEEQAFLDAGGFTG